MNIHDCILSSRKVRKENTVQNITWATVVKKKSEKINRGKGFAPISLEESFTNDHFPPLNKSDLKNLKKQQHNNKSKTITKEEFDDPSESLKISFKMTEPDRFVAVYPEEQETRTGWRTQSNDAIERWIREKQAKTAEQCNTSGDASNDSFITCSSESTTNESYITALQDSFEEMQVQKEKVNKKILESNKNLYKKNILIAGLLKKAKEAEEACEKEEHESNNNQEVFVEVVVGGDEDDNDLQTNNDTVNLDDRIDDETLMQSDRIGRLFQSEHDEDLYVHPLQERIRHDPVWRNQRLERQGTTTVNTPRQFYMSLTDDCFVFARPNEENNSV